MTRGKYAARTANREARLDNELLAEKMQQLETLQADMARLEATLAVERKDRGATVVHRVEELSRQAIEQARRETREEVTAHEGTRHYVAGWLTDYLDKLVEANPKLNVLIPEPNMHEFLATLVGDAHVGDYIQHWVTGALGEKVEARRYRRVAAKALSKPSPAKLTNKPALVARMKMDRGVAPTAVEQAALEHETFSPAETLAGLLHQPWENDE